MGIILILLLRFSYLEKDYTINYDRSVSKHINVGIGLYKYYEDLRWDKYLYTEYIHKKTTYTLYIGHQYGNYLQFTINKKL